MLVDLNFKHPSLKIFFFLIRLLPTGLTFKIIKGPLKGFKWITGAAAGSAKGISVLFNCAEKKQLKLVKKNIDKKSIFFYIGANVGLYTLLFARYSKKVFSFEPLPRNISYLYKTLKINNIFNADIIPCAISNENNIDYFKRGKNASMGMLSKNGDLPVITLSIDYFISKIGIIPDVLKIDVEGVELKVLKGTENLLKNHSPKIFLSTHGEKKKQIVLII